MKGKRPVGQPGPAIEEIVRLQNEQICEKLLRWYMRAPADKDCPAVWRETAEQTQGGRLTPTFTTWEESTLILRRLFEMGYGVHMWRDHENLNSVISTNGVRSLALRNQEEPIVELIRRIAIMVIET